METVTFEITFKANCPSQATYNAVKARIDGLDLASIGQNAVKTIQPDNNPDGYVISIKVTGENTPPS